MKSAARSVTAIVLNYCSSQDTAACVRTLLEQTYTPLACVVVDNCSPDGSFQELKAAFANEPQVTVIKSDRNGGYAAGNNAGARWALSHHNPSYFLVLNPDVELADKSTVDQLVAFAEEQPNAAVVSPKVILPNGFVQGPYPRPSLFRSCLQYLFPFIWFVSRKRHQKWAANLRYPTKCFRTIGCCMLLKASDFMAVGMFDESTFLEGEEQILADRLTRSQKSFYHYPAVTVVHNHSRRGRFEYTLASSKYYFSTYQGAGGASLRVLELCIKVYERLYLPIHRKMSSVSH